MRASRAVKMTNTERNDLYRDLHETFVRESGRVIRWDMGKLLAWERWAAQAWNKADLIVVISYLKVQIKRGKAFLPQLWFRNLIEDIDRFQEYLADALATRRNAPQPVSPKQKVLEAFYQAPVRKPTTEAKPVSYYIDKLRLEVENAKTRTEP